MKRTFFTTILVTSIFCELKAQDASSETVISADQLSQYLQVISSLNHGIALDGGGSLGTSGTRFGLGMRQIKYDNLDNGLSNSNMYTNKENGANFQLPFIMISKGIAESLNLGFNLGTFNKHRVSMMQLHAQFTVVEKFRFPAIAWRLQHQTTFGLQSTTYQAWQTGPVMSYSPFAVVTVNFRGGWAFHTATVNNNLLKQNVVYLVNASENESYSKSWNSHYFAIGFSLLALPPFGNAGLEVIRQQGNRDSYLFNTSINI